MESDSSVAVSIFPRHASLSAFLLSSSWPISWSFSASRLPLFAISSCVSFTEITRVMFFGFASRCCASALAWAASSQPALFVVVVSVFISRSLFLFSLAPSVRDSCGRC